MKKKFTLDIHSKTWWVSLIFLILVFGQQIGHLLGWEITSDQINQIMGIVNTVLLIAGSLGLVYDTSKVPNNDDKIDITSNGDLVEVKTPNYSQINNTRRN